MTELMVMGNNDWYRNKNWDDQIESAFRARLKRSRGDYYFKRDRLDQAYDLYLTFAMLYDAMGCAEAAKQYAATALKASEQSSPFVRKGIPLGKASIAEREFSFLTAIITLEK
jgi:hypothetical protein